MNILKILTRERLVGNFGEDEAAKFLKRRGFRIVKRNYVAGGGEIDIIAANREFLLFVEVKTRAADGDSRLEMRPASAVTPEKQRKIIGAASHFPTYLYPERKLRFDVVEVYYAEIGKKRKVTKIEHLEGAFTKSSAYRPRG